MDGLGWNGLSEVAANSILPMWNSTQQINDIENSYLISNSNLSMDLPEDIFNINPIQEVLQKGDHQPSNFNMLQQCQGERLAAADPTSSLIMKPANWEDVALMNGAYGLSTISQAINDGGATTTDQSLDCLLSATNSNTDTSVEDDDGISMIFSDCKNIWSFAAAATNSSTAVSSGESENNVSNTAGSKDFNCPDETVSLQSTNSSDQITKPSSTLKRGRSSDQSHDHDQFKVGLNCGYFNILQSSDSSGANEGGFRLISPENTPKTKKARTEKRGPSSSNINFQQPSNSSVSSSIDHNQEPDSEAIAQMKEMIYRAAAFRPVNLGLEMVEKPKRKNVRISSDPQTVAARQRRERISERIRVLQRLVPGGSKMDTASMLDEAANYLKFLRSQVKALENLGHNQNHNLAFSSSPLINQSLPMQIPPLLNPNHHHIHHTQS